MLTLLPCSSPSAAGGGITRDSAARAPSSPLQRNRLTPRSPRVGSPRGRLSRTTKPFVTYTHLRTFFASNRNAHSPRFSPSPPRQCRVLLRHWTSPHVVASLACSHSCFAAGSARISAGCIFSILCIAYALSGLNLWSYFHQASLYPDSCHSFNHRSAGTRLRGRCAALSLDASSFSLACSSHLPSFWVAVEFLNSLTSPHGTAGNLGYTQMNFLPILQIASVTGIWAISFCVFLFAATVAIILGGHGSAASRRTLTTAVAVLLLAVLGFGIWRLRSPPVSTHTVKVGSGRLRPAPEHTRRQTCRSTSALPRICAQAETLAAQGAKAVVIPEKDRRIARFEPCPRSTRFFGPRPIRLER